MKYCSFSAHRRETFGCELRPGLLIDLCMAGRKLLDLGILGSSAERLLQSQSLIEWLSNERSALEVAEEIRAWLDKEGDKDFPGVFPRTETRILAPIRRPRKIIAVGLNYRDHAREQNKELPEVPMIFAKFPTSVIGPEEPIRLPTISKKVDAEAELCVVILETCRQLSRDDARRVAAFTIGNDVSARDVQYSDKQWVRGKSCDTFAPTGPFILTGDEVEDPHRLDIELHLNEEVQQSSNTGQLIFDCYELIEFISQAITLEPGDLIFTGTPGGVGVFRDPPVFLEPGDILEVTIEKLGTLRNPVVAG